MPVQSTKADRLMSVIAKKQSLKNTSNISVKPVGEAHSFTTFLIADRMLSVLSEKEIDSFIRDAGTSSSIAEAKK